MSAEIEVQGQPVLDGVVIDARTELEEIKSQGQQGRQLVIGALERLSEFIESGKWGKVRGSSGACYKSLQTFMAMEFPDIDSLKLPLGLRRQLVTAYGAEGCSQARTAQVLGIDQATVSRDLKSVSAGQPPGIMQVHNNSDILPRPAAPLPPAAPQAAQRDGQATQAPPESVADAPQASVTCVSPSPAVPAAEPVATVPPPVPANVVVVKLQRELTTVTDERDRIKAERNRLSGELDEVRAELSLQKEAYEALERQLADQKRTTEARERQCEQEQQSVRKLTDELAMAQARIAEMETRLPRLPSENDYPFADDDD